MKKLLLACCLFLFTGLVVGQNVGVGVPNPQEKLEVNGTVKATTIAVTQGNQYDVLKKDAGSAISFTKGSKGQGLNYIIATQGIFPPSSGSPSYNHIILGEIRLFAGNFAPAGFAFCHGQILPIAQNTALFSLLGTSYGGNGQTTFALPDLRGAVPVGAGTPAAGASWELGEKN